MKFKLTSCLSVGLTLLWILAQPNRGQAAEGEQGKELFERRCSGCHSLDKDKEGPRLHGVYGRVAGSVPGFEYSDALKASHLTWDADTLDRWLTDPEQFVHGNDMAFRLVKADERAAIIAFLKAQRAVEK
jgi:cytochrome c